MKITKCHDRLSILNMSSTKTPWKIIFASLLWRGHEGCEDFMVVIFEKIEGNKNWTLKCLFYHEINYLTLFFSFFLSFPWTRKNFLSFFLKKELKNFFYLFSIFLLSLFSSFFVIFWVFVFIAPSIAIKQKKSPEEFISKTSQSHST